jgi:hypothetical protein
MRDTSYNCYTSNKLQVTQEMHNYRFIQPFSNISAIPEIRTCRRALSKYTLRQLCNYTFPDPCCHTLFFVSLYEESIFEVLPLSLIHPVYPIKVQLPRVCASASACVRVWESRAWVCHICMYKYMYRVGQDPSGPCTAIFKILQKGAWHQGRLANWQSVII